MGKSEKLLVIVGIIILIMIIIGLLYWVWYINIMPDHTIDDRCDYCDKPAKYELREEGYNEIDIDIPGTSASKGEVKEEYCEDHKWIGEFKEDSNTFYFFSLVLPIIVIIPLCIAILLLILELHKIKIKKLKTEIRQMKIKKDIEGLIKTMDSSYSEIRAEAAQALDKLDWKPKDSKERDHYLIARKQWDELIRLGKSSVEPLINAMNKYYDLREATAKALVKIGAPAVEPLTRTLKVKDWDVRKRAAETLGNIGDARAVKPLIQTLRDKNFDVRDATAEALVKIGKPAVEPLIQTLKDKDWLVRRKAAQALGNIGDTRAVESLIQALRDKIRYVRMDAAEALGKIGDERALEPLTQTLKDKYNEAQGAAKRALEKIKSRKS